MAGRWLQDSRCGSQGSQHDSYLLLVSGEDIGPQMDVTVDTRTGNGTY